MRVKIEPQELGDTNGLFHLHIIGIFFFAIFQTFTNLKQLFVLVWLFLQHHQGCLP